MLPLPPSSTWWTFFPFFGIEVPDSEDPLSRPLFGDATLVSQATLQLLLGRPGVLQDTMYRQRQYATYLGIRHEGIVNLQWFSEDRRNEQFLAEVRQRAREVGGLITSAFLARHQTAYLCGLIEYEGWQRFDTNSPA